MKSAALRPNAEKVASKIPTGLNLSRLVSILSDTDMIRGWKYVTIAGGRSPSVAS